MLGVAFLRSVKIRSAKRVSLVSVYPMTPAEENDFERSALDFLFSSFCLKTSS